MDELRRIDLNLLLTLHALLTERHVTRASVRLHKSQPAVSHSLAQLRVHFNDQLLIRRDGYMALTAKAQALKDGDGFNEAQCRVLRQKNSVVIEKTAPEHAGTLRLEFGAGQVPAFWYFLRFSCTAT